MEGTAKCHKDCLISFCLIHCTVRKTKLEKKVSSFKFSVIWASSRAL